jgi:opacity protein-like surface antigen
VSRHTGIAGLLICVSAGVLPYPGTVRAGDFDEAFSLRLPAALSRFSSYGDVAAAGGASAGSKWLSSINPASTGWLEIPGRLGVSLSPQYSLICFAEGAKLHVATESLAWDSRQWGVFQPAVAQVRSNTSTTRQGLKFQYEMDYFQMQWGRRVGEDWAFGANVNVSTSETRFDYGRAPVSGCNGETYGLRLGGLHRPVERVLLGLVFDYAFCRSRTTLYDLSGMGLGDVKIRDTTHQFLLRPGASFEYKEDSAVYFDYQFGSFCNDEGDLRVHRFWAGVDHQLFGWLYVRAGASLDARGNPAWTAGVGVYPTDWFTVDVAYQDDMFPEVAREFGRSRLVTLSVGLRF